MYSTGLWAVSTLTFCTIAFAGRFTVSSIMLCHKRFCAVAYIRGMICALASTPQITTNAVGQPFPEGQGLCDAGRYLKQRVIVTRAREKSTRKTPGHAGRHAQCRAVPEVACTGTVRLAVWSCARSSTSYDAKTSRADLVSGST